MNGIILGIGESGASRNADDEIKTLGLGSCVAVILLDPGTHAVGMVHIALPDSSVTTPEEVKKRPGRFADTGIDTVLRDMASQGARDPRKMIVKLIGGATIMDPNNTFNVGKRNVLAIKKILWEKGMGARAEDVGGNYSRTVIVSVATGIVKVRSPGRGEWKV